MQKRRISDNSEQQRIDQLTSLSLLNMQRCTKQQIFSNQRQIKPQQRRLLL